MTTFFRDSMKDLLIHDSSHAHHPIYALDHTATRSHSLNWVKFLAGFPERFAEMLLKNEEKTELLSDYVVSSLLGPSHTAGLVEEEERSKAVHDGAFASETRPKRRKQLDVALQKWEERREESSSLATGRGPPPLLQMNTRQGGPEMTSPNHDDRTRTQWHQLSLAEPPGGGLEEPGTTMFANRSKIYHPLYVLAVLIRAENEFGIFPFATRKAVAVLEAAFQKKNVKMNQRNKSIIAEEDHTKRQSEVEDNDLSRVLVFRRESTSGKQPEEHAEGATKAGQPHLQQELAAILDSELDDYTTSSPDHHHFLAEQPHEDVVERRERTPSSDLLSHNINPTSSSSTLNITYSTEATHVDLVANEDAWLKKVNKQIRDPQVCQEAQVGRSSEKAHQAQHIAKSPEQRDEDELIVQQQTRCLPTHSYSEVRFALNRMRKLSQTELNPEYRELWGFTYMDLQNAVKKAFQRLQTLLELAHRHWRREKVKTYFERLFQARFDHLVHDRGTAGYLFSTKDTDVLTPWRLVNVESLVTTPVEDAVTEQMRGYPGGLPAAEAERAEWQNPRRKVRRELWAENREKLERKLQESVERDEFSVLQVGGRRNRITTEKKDAIDHKKTSTSDVMADHLHEKDPTEDEEGAFLQEDAHLDGQQLGNDHVSVEANAVPSRSTRTPLLLLSPGALARVRRTSEAAASLHQSRPELQEELEVAGARRPERPPEGTPPRQSSTRTLLQLQPVSELIAKSKTIRTASRTHFGSIFNVRKNHQLWALENPYDLWTDFADEGYLATPLADYAEDHKDTVLERIFEVIGVHNHFFVEIGTGLGTECNSRYWRVMRGWDVRMFDATADLPHINLRQQLINPDNVNEVFASHAVPQTFDVLSIDVDSFDWHLLRAVLLQGKFLPRVIIVEHTASMHPFDARYFSRYFNATKTARSDGKRDGFGRGLYQYWSHFGSSILTFLDLANAFRYDLVYYCDTDLVFVHRDSHFGTGLELRKDHSAALRGGKKLSRTTSSTSTRTTGSSSAASANKDSRSTGEDIPEQKNDREQPPSTATRTSASSEVEGGVYGLVVVDEKNIDHREEPPRLNGITEVFGDRDDSTVLWEQYTPEKDTELRRGASLVQWQEGEERRTRTTIADLVLLAETTTTAPPPPPSLPASELPKIGSLSYDVRNAVAENDGRRPRFLGINNPTKLCELYQQSGRSVARHRLYRGNENYCFPKSISPQWSLEEIRLNFWPSPKTTFTPQELRDENVKI
ncbi:unnamed protein product [Amoebophrya sp. A120]|nr:unnamed protein product [Amoebophrya sp. A120]|eukprot:GSA120T00000221001.1